MEAIDELKLEIMINCHQR